MEKGNWRKRLLAGGCAVVLLLSGLFSGMGLKRLFLADGEEVPVYSVEGLRDKKWSDAVVLPATVESGSLTAYYYDSRKPTVELYVEEGQSVKVGTPLLRYDCSALEEELSRVERSLENQRIYLDRLGSFLGYLKATKPRPESLGQNQDRTDGRFAVVSAGKGAAERSLSTFGIVTAPVSAEESLEGFVEAEGRDRALTVYEKIDETSVPSGGRGSAQDPYVYYVKKGGEVAPEVLAMLVRMKLCGRFVVVEDEASAQTPLFVWTFDGKVYEAVIQGEAPSESSTETSPSAPESSLESLEESSSPEESSESVPEGMESTDSTEHVPTSGAEESGVETEHSSESEESSSDSEGETLDDGSFDDDALNEALGGLESEPQGYTKEELARAIRERSLEYENLELAIRRNELQAESLKREIEENVLTAETDGQVRTAADPREAARLGQPVLTVQGKSGSLLCGQMNEVLAAVLKPGDRLTVSAKIREKEVSFTATLRSVEREPGAGSMTDTDAAGGGVSGGGDSLSDGTENGTFGDGTAVSPVDGGAGNPAMSYYRFSASLEETKGIRAGDAVEILIPRTDVGQRTEGEDSLNGRIVLPDRLLCYEGGAAFVYTLGEDGRLEKRSVETGRSFGGTETEVLSGITEEDYLARPEEAAGMEGARVRIVYGEEMEIKTEESKGWEETEP